jgi:hypothetical protein
LQQVASAQAPAAAQQQNGSLSISMMSHAFPPEISILNLPGDAEYGLFADPPSGPARDPKKNVWSMHQNLPFDFRWPEKCTPGGMFHQVFIASSSGAFAENAICNAGTVAVYVAPTFRWAP